MRERSPSLYSWTLLAVIVLVAGIAVWVVSPRFELDTPSLEDDWAAIVNSSDQVSDLARFENPEQQRFRPGWIVWNYVQWHTFDAPQSLVGPNFWNVVRLLVLVAGLALFTMLALPRPRRPWEAVIFSLLAGVPALLVVMVPKFARDMTRFGTQEPLLIGGLALGGSLLVLAARSLLDESRRAAVGQTVVLGIGGSFLWLLGAYQKESSVCALPLIAAVAFAGRSHLASWTGLSAMRKVSLGAIAAVVVLPLVHVTVETLRITARGDLVYDAEVDEGRGVLRGMEALWDWTHEVFSSDARLVLWAAVGATLLATIVRRRVDVIAVGALASGALTFAFAGQSGVVVSRYYMPVYALFAVALVLSLARLPRIFQLAGLAWIALAFVPAPGMQSEVESWVYEERQDHLLVSSLADVVAAGCTAAIGGLDLESSSALPVLVRLEQDREGRCERGSTYLVVRPAGEGLGLMRACAPRALTPILELVTGTLYRCARLREGLVDDPVLGPTEAERLVALRRLTA